MQPTNYSTLMLHVISKTNTIANHFIAEMRDTTIQADSMRFRKNMKRLGQIISYEISKTLEYVPAEVITPLGTAVTSVLSSQPVLATILRAGLPLHEGMLDFLDKAENAFISSYRRHHKDGTFDIQVEYVSSPSIDNKVVILADPMIATGQSMYLAYKALLQKGNPKAIHIVGLIASVEGLEYLQRRLPSTAQLWIGAIDEEMTVQSYIVPGLGDAGDLAYGSKSVAELV